MEEDERDPEVLRRRLYRPDASRADLDSYLEVAPPTTEAASSQGRAARRVIARRRRWWFGIAGVAVALALGGAALGVGALAPAPQPPPTPSSTPPGAGWTAAPRDPGDTLVATAVVDGGRRVHATGRAVPAPGEGYLYTIAVGDSMTAIAARFRLCAGDVLLALPYGADPRTPPAGQRLLLEPGTGTPGTPRSC